MGNTQPLGDPRVRRVAEGDFVYRDARPPVFVRGEGYALYDDNGFKYLDAEASNGSANLGYDGSILDEAVEKTRDLPGLPSFCESALRLRVSERLAELVESAVGKKGRVAFELGGAQGIELALKVARLSNTTSHVVVFEGGYHGRSYLASQLSASRRYREVMGTSSLPVLRLPYPDCEQCRFAQEPTSCRTECLSFSVRSLSDDTAGWAGNLPGDVICAVLVEPMLNAGGLVWPDPRYLEGAVAACRARGALVIVDEVFTGLYRTGSRWGFQNYRLEPDIVVVSKALTNGLAPLSCVWARDPLLTPERFPPGTHSTTFANYVLGLAIADTVFDRYDSWSGIERDVAALERHLMKALQLIGSSTLVRSVAVRGGVGRILLSHPIASDVRRAALRIGRTRPIGDFHGLLIAATGMSPWVVGVHPPLNIDPKGVSLMAELLLSALVETEIHAAKAKA